MYAIVANGQVVGMADSIIGLPEGWVLYESPSGSMSSIYFDGNQVVLKPPKPSEDSYWDEQNNQWTEPTYNEVPVAPVVSENPLAIAVKQKLSQDVDPFLAEVLAYMLAKIQLDDVTATNQLGVIQSMLTSGS